jgi:hypothetical protein
MAKVQASSMVATLASAIAKADGAVFEADPARYRKLVLPAA